MLASGLQARVAQLDGGTASALEAEVGVRGAELPRPAQRGVGERARRQRDEGGIELVTTAGRARC